MYSIFSADVVITLFDSAAGETSPVWFADAIKLHWRIDELSKLSGSDADFESAFLRTIELTRLRVLLISAVACPSIKTGARRWSWGCIDGSLKAILTNKFFLGREPML